MRVRLLTIPVLLLAAALPLGAHVGSPDVFFEGSAGPYRLFVTVRMPQVIPGVAEIEVRSEVLFDPCGSIVELFVGETKDSEASLVQVSGYARGLGIETGCGRDFLEKRRFDQRYAGQ